MPRVVPTPVHSFYRTSVSLVTELRFSEARGTLVIAKQ